MKLRKKFRIMLLRRACAICNLTKRYFTPSKKIQIFPEICRVLYFQRISSGTLVKLTKIQPYCKEYWFKGTTLLSLLTAFHYERIKDENLLRAARTGNVKEIKRLVESGVDVNQRHVYGWTPLQVAAMNGHRGAVEELLKLGADIDLGDDFSNVYQVAKEKRVHSLEGISPWRGLNPRSKSTAAMEKKIPIYHNFKKKERKERIRF